MQPEQTPKQKREAATATLTQLVPRGAVVWAIGEPSRTNMSETVRLFTTSKGHPDDGEPTMLELTALVAQLMGKTLTGRCASKTGLRVSGFGLNRRFHIVYQLSLTLYGDGYAITGREF